MKEIFKNSFFYLLVVYALLVALSFCNIIPKHIIHFEIFALILAVLGIFVINRGKKKRERKGKGKRKKRKKEKAKGKARIKKYKTIFITILLISIFLILFFRILPYLHNSIPLGYDAGMYKHAIEQSSSGQQLDNWAANLYPRGFLFITNAFYWIGFSTNQILIGLFIFFFLLLGITIFFVTKKFLNQKAALIALLLFAVSTVQFKFFTYLYYKNLIGLILLLWSFYFLKARKYVPLVICAGFLGGVHRPTFLLFGLSFLAYTVFSCFFKQKKKIKVCKKSLKINIIVGLSVLAIALLFYIGRFKETLFSFIKPLTIDFSIGVLGAGTFIKFFNYQFLSLAYLPFAILGFFMLIKKEKFNLKSNILFLWLVINVLIVMLKLFFYNRFIIPLDLAIIIFASFGLVNLFRAIKRKKSEHTEHYMYYITIAAISLLVVSAGILTFKEAEGSRPLISNKEFNAVKQLNETESKAWIMSTSSKYSPWIVGYSNRKTIAPGLFGYDNWTYDEWFKFYKLSDSEKAIDMIEKSYANCRPIYIFIGSSQALNEEKFDHSCFELYFDDKKTKIYKYIC